MNAHASSQPQPRFAIVSTVAAGIGLAVALQVASVWVPQLSYAAIAVAVVTAVAAAWTGQRILARQKAEATANAHLERAQHRESLSTFHASQREVLSIVDGRTDALRRDLAETRADLGEAQMEISRLTGDNAVLRQDNERLRRENDELLALAAPAPGSDSQVVALPRRRAAAEHNWSSLEAPTVVDLDLQRLVSPLVEELRRAHAN